MENKSHAMVAGTFVLVLVLMLAGLALWLTRDREQYKEYELSTADAISGLQNQATVRYKGVAVGKVTEITFDNVHKGNVLIKIAVDTKAPVSPTDTYAILGYQGVTGIAHIQLDDAAQPMQALPKGADGLPRLPMRSSPLSVIASQGITILSKVDETMGSINKLLSAENQQHFGSVLVNLSEAMGNVNAVTSSMHAILNEQVAPVMKEFPALAQDARKAMQALESAGEQTSELANEVRNVATALTAPNGILAQVTEGSQALAQASAQFNRATLPAISQTAADVSTAAQRISNVASGFANNPQSLIYGSRNNLPGPGEPGFAAPQPAQ